MANLDQFRNGIATQWQDTGTKVLGISIVNAIEQRLENYQEFLVVGEFADSRIKIHLVDDLWEISFVLDCLFGTVQVRVDVDDHEVARLNYIDHAATEYDIELFIRGAFKKIEQYTLEQSL